MRDLVGPRIHLGKRDRAPLEQEERPVGRIRRALLEQVGDAVGLVAAVTHDPGVAAGQPLLRHLAWHHGLIAHGPGCPLACPFSAAA